MNPIDVAKHEKESCQVAHFAELENWPIHTDPAVPQEARDVFLARRLVQVAATQAAHCRPPMAAG